MKLVLVVLLSVITDILMLVYIFKGYDAKIILPTLATAALATVITWLEFRDWRKTSAPIEYGDASDPGIVKRAEQDSVC